jgi:hypothetical protein
MELPLGYREFITSFGPGTVSDILCVNTPREITGPSRQREDNRYRLAVVAQWRREQTEECALTPDDIEQAIVFAWAAAETPIWIASRRIGPRLFEQGDDYVAEVPQGFFGLVELCTDRQNHTFPFFEPRNGRRRMRVFAVRPAIGRDEFVAAMAGCWGRDSLRCSRPAREELHPHYFVPAIEGHVELLLAPSSLLPSGGFFVRARYDIDSEAEVTEFAASTSLPGGTSSNYLGDAW